MYIKLDNPLTIIFKAGYFNRSPVICLGYSGLKYWSGCEHLLRTYEFICYSLYTSRFPQMQKTPEMQV